MEASGECGRLEKLVRVRIHGVVQGVWFRAWTVEQAEERRLRGWVRNLPDGSVEALFAGRATDVEAMLVVCRSGPPRATVHRIDTEAVTEMLADGDLPDGFEKRPTA